MDGAVEDFRTDALVTLIPPRLNFPQPLFFYRVAIANTQKDTRSVRLSPPQFKEGPVRYI